MEINAYFSDIHTTIVDHLREAEDEIIAAVAWFTDREIFEVLCKKAALGVSVSVALIGDNINRGAGRLNFQKLRDLGGQVIFVPQGGRDEPLMHHKFCVIDTQTVITGSYNWSHKARTNDENITVITEAPEMARQYLDAFHDLVDRYHPGSIAPEAEAEAARRRLELIRNLVILGEQEGIDAHLEKLRPVSAELNIDSILDSLNTGNFTKALELIEAYLRQATALVQAGDIEIPHLKLHLQALELRLEALSDEKAELERRLVVFNRRHDAALGELIQRVLKAKADLAKIFAEVAEDGEAANAQTKAKEAYERYSDYAEQHHTLQEAAPLPSLDPESEQELKQLYRKACHLCHPDKFAEAQKAEAHAAFVALQDAYRSNDLARVREIYETLKAGGTLTVRSSLLGEAEALKAAIAQMEHNISNLVRELKALRNSDALRLIESIEETNAGWKLYVDTRRSELEAELEQTEEQIAQYHEEAGLYGR